MSPQSGPRLVALGMVAGLLFVVATAAVAVASSSPNPGPFTGCLSARIGILYSVAPGASPVRDCRRGDTLISFSDSAPAAFPDIYSVLVSEVVTSQTAQVRAFCDAGDQVISGGYQSVYGDIVTTSLPVLGSPNGWQVWINKAGSAASGQTVIFQVTAVCADTAN